jgi:XTP/dITP diphosphohydrolase
MLVTSPRVAAGLLSADAWFALQSGPAYLSETAAAHSDPLTKAGVAVHPIDPGLGPRAVAQTLIDSARELGTATVVVGPERDQALIGAVEDLLAGASDRIAFEVLDGSWDLPGAHLLDVVATMDRLRSPGGCPWDAEQDHATLAPYLLEEAYEAFQMIEDSDLRGLRDELGDVLLQVAFHARLAEELSDEERWSIDDVADGLVNKLVRRHPHVFADVDVSGAGEVNANWETIKAAERGGKSPLASVPMSAAALTLASTLQRKALRAGVDVTTESIEDAVARYRANASVESAGELLWAIVAVMRSAGIDPETALRARARDFRDTT